MSDLSEAVRDHVCSGPMHEDPFMQEIADALEAKDAEIERLKAALAESCDENRTVVLEEGPFSTDMCPLASKQQAEIERLRAALKEAAKSLAEDEQEIELLNCALTISLGKHEIERLNCALTISLGKHENAIREIERLQAALKRIAEETAATWVCDVARAALERGD